MKKLEIGDRYLYDGKVYEVHSLDNTRSLVENQYVWRMKDISNNFLTSISHSNLEEAEYVGDKNINVKNKRLSRIE